MNLRDSCVQEDLTSKKKKPFSSRSVARALAIQGVFMIDGPCVNGLQRFLRPIIECGAHALFRDDGDDTFYPFDTVFAQNIIFGVQTHKDLLQEIIETGLSKFRTVLYLEEVTKSILLCGAWELKYATENPVSVILYEYVQWAKHFLPEGGSGFVHGVLDKIRPVLRG
ncbi:MULTISPECIES: transcription antitermination factor NusB [Holospora]|uniref:NusB/RsmB/TIM44 domain-containing protein n=2 Tax=Holospora TaxID=44747 RepID=A0A061JGK0_9PROT|nr:MULTISPECIES: transcription antitermination protein NusB [Holospora]ETZ05231.1 hypothetical protein K737_300340 [Holospora undulata HU1]GAJ46258.1 hypothetical protein HE1_00584 [Holospora elegans E1]